MHMPPVRNITDPTFVKTDLNSIDSFFNSMIRDERDLPFIHLSIKISLTLIPSAILLYTPLLTGYYWYAWAIFHLILCVGIYLGPYTLMLHNTSHRPFFKRAHDRWNRYIPWVLGPFMGQSPELYFMHHMGMHHAEGNMPEDRSTTMPFQRDSFLGFLQYYFRFIVVGILDLVNYFLGKKRNKMARKAASIEYGFYVILAVIAFFFGLLPTLFVFVIPVLLVRFGMMSGNWGQHAFVDPEEPDNDYKNSITCINAGYNKKCFNDGYHIGHHLVPNMHWTDMPGEFLENLDKYAENKALVFEGLDFHMVWILLMLKKYDTLADHIVNVNGSTFTDRQDAIDTMKKRTQRFNKEALAAFS